MFTVTPYHTFEYISSIKLTFFLLFLRDEEKSEEKIQQEEEQATEEDRRLEKIYDKELEHLRREEVARKLARDQEATQPKHMAWESNKPKPTNNKDIGIQQPRQHNHTTYRLGHVNKN